MAIRGGAPTCPRHRSQPTRVPSRRGRPLERPCPKCKKDADAVFARKRQTVWAIKVDYAQYTCRAFTDRLDRDLLRTLPQDAQRDDEISEALSSDVPSEWQTAAREAIISERKKFPIAPEDRVVRDAVRSTTVRIFHALARKSDTDDVLRFRGEASELIADIGSYGGTEAELKKGADLSAVLGQYAIGCYVKIGNEVCLIRALLGTHNHRRPFSGDDESEPLVRKAYHIGCALEQKQRYADDPKFMSLFRATTVWFARFCASEYPRNQGDRFKQLAQLETHLSRLIGERDTEVARSERHGALLNSWKRLRQCVAFDEGLRRKIDDRIATHLVQLSDIDRTKLPFVETASRLRAEIQYRVESEGSNRVDPLIVEYAEAYRKAPNCYYRKGLLEWKRLKKQYFPVQLDDLPEPTFFTSYHAPLRDAGLWQGD